MFFDYGTISTNDVVTKSLRTLNSCVSSRKGLKIRRFLDPPWLQLPVGWFDGETSTDGMQSGAGGIIRISDMTVYKWTFNTGPGTNNRVELLGVWVTLFLALRLHLIELQIIGDSKIIIDWCNGRGRL